MLFDKEYHPSIHEYSVPEEEFHVTAEVQGRTGDEFNMDVHEPDHTETAEKRGYTLRKMNKLLQLGAVLAAVVVMHDSFGRDLLGRDIFNRSGTPAPVKVEEEEPEPADTEPRFEYPLPDNVVRTSVHVRVLPDGGSFLLEAAGIGGLLGARAIAADWGADPESMEILSTENVYYETVDGKDYYTHVMYVVFYK